LIVAAISAAILLGLTFVRLLIGPTLYDRLIAANAIVLELALACGGLAVWRQTTAYADVAIALVFCLLVVNVAGLKFFSAGSFQPPLNLSEERAP
jgi:multicomponent Na+:H+ antiporter subunit F